MPRPSTFWHTLITILLGIIGLMAYAVSKFYEERAIVVVTVLGVLGFLVSLVVLMIRARRPAASLRALVVCVLGTAIGFYALLAGLLFFFQDTIANRTNAFFQPKSLAAVDAQALTTPQVQPLELTAPDGTRLRGWLVKNTNAPKSPLIIYFHGSGSEASKMIPYFQRVTGWSIALINYRGFGQSEGIPSQARAFDDATFLFDTFSARDDIDSTKIVSMGWSLGTGVAVYLSEQRPTAATVLVAPFDRYRLIGLQPPGIYAPLAGMLKPYFDSIARAQSIKTPLLTLLGSEDKQVPPEMSLKLVQQWGGEAKVNTYQGEDHRLLMHDPSSWKDIPLFLSNLDQK